MTTHYPEGGAPPTTPPVVEDAGATGPHSSSPDRRPPTGVEQQGAGKGAGPIRVAYADPPYLGCCRLYDHHHPDGLCWDDLTTHKLLIERLCADYPDGWALSCHTPSLRELLPLCPDDVRAGAWVKPFHAYKKGVRPAYGWEPVLYRGGRNKKPPAPPKGGKAITPKDFFVDRSEEFDLFTTPATACNITLRKGLTGAKPEAVCEWILDLLNVLPGDQVHDLYPGTGVMSRVAAARTRLHFGYLPECSDGADCERQGCLKAHIEPRVTPPTDPGARS